jgi:YD repeat-containing protein
MKNRMKNIIKTTFLALFICATAGSAQAQNQFAAPTLASYQVNGKVSSVKIETFKAKGTAKSYTVGEPKNSRPAQTLFFNAQGQQTAQKTFDLAMPDMVMSHIEYSYNAAGKFIEMAQLEPVKYIFKTLTYDSDGQVNSLTFGSDEKAVPINFSYSEENGKKIATGTSSRLGVGNVVEKYTFNAQGLVEEEQNTSEKAVNNETTRYKYDSENRLIEMQRFDFNQKPRGGTAFKYNEQGYIAEVLTSSADLATATKLIFIYKYDDKGNWIEQAEVEKGFVYTVIRRTITYSAD